MKYDIELAQWFSTQSQAQTVCSAVNSEEILILEITMESLNNADYLSRIVKFTPYYFSHIYLANKKAHVSILFLFLDHSCCLFLLNRNN